MRHWFLRRKRRNIGFLLTIGEFSHAVLMSVDGSISLFDSHGQLTYQGKAFKRLAGAVKFPSAAELSQFLTEMYGRGKHCAIALVCVHFPRQSHQRVSRKRNQAEHTYRPLRLTSTHKLPDIQVDGVSLYNSEEEGMSPFITLLGGGG